MEGIPGSWPAHGQEEETAPVTAPPRGKSGNIGKLLRRKPVAESTGMEMR